MALQAGVVPVGAVTKGDDLRAYLAEQPRSYGKLALAAGLHGFWG